ncbi:MAG TPA: DsrE family protein [Burkholderiaceae bacterium]|jgi:intracellular sulfur oxidation DsrE/DsrF family protein|nr:DsrE family protein [Burkholderiaceae bacterium]
MQRRLALAVGAAILTGALGACSAMAPGPTAQSEMRKVVFQVSEADPKNWNLALNNLRNVQQAIGKDKVLTELVVYGPGIAMLKAESKVEPRITQALTDGVRVVACENTMHAQKLTKADMIPGIGYVPGGVVELMERQREGWAYIRP